MSRDPIDNYGFSGGHGSYRYERECQCPCGQQFTTMSRNKLYCDGCQIKRNLNEKYGAAIRPEVAA